MLRENSLTISPEEQARFLAACESFQAELRERNGIGTLGEKTVHATLKRYLEPDPSRHEVLLEDFVVDIYNEDGVTEIQTAGFHRMRRKIDRFLPEIPLRIVYPIAARNHVSWFDPETGEELSRRLSPKRGTRRDALYELYKIRQWLLEPGLRIELYYIDVEEHRLQDGWGKNNKRRATKVDRLPTALDRIEVLASPEDYLAYVPDNLPERFTVKQFAKIGKYTERHGQIILRILRDFGLVQHVDTEGRAFVYKLAPCVEDIETC